MEPALASVSGTQAARRDNVHRHGGYTALGQRNESLSLALVEELKDGVSRSYKSPADMGIAEFGLGLEEEAFIHFEEAYEEHSSWLLYFKAFPAFGPLREDAHYKRILVKMGRA
jgi:hypothetical protein